MLVEDAVVRKEVLTVDRSQGAVRADGAGVREVAVEPRRAHQGDDAGRGAGDLLERSVRGRHEAGTEEEILGRVARDRELRKDGEVGACAARVIEGGEDPVAVSLEVADDGVELRQGDPQGFRLTVTNLV